MDGQAAIGAVQLAGSVTGGHDFSIIGLFLEADPIVKGVLGILLFSSIWTWSVIFDKSLRFRNLRERAGLFEERFWSGISLEGLYEKMGKRPGDPMAATFMAAMREWKLAAEKGLMATSAMRSNLQQRIERVMQVTIGREMERIESNMVPLASIGSMAPFVGLFGTVWGIMNSFTAIASAQNTTLAVVAPHIAEALFATAMGLVAAIPAAAAYNKFTNDINHYSDRLDNFSNEFAAIMSRNLEEQRG